MNLRRGLDYRGHATLRLMSLRTVNIMGLVDVYLVCVPSLAWIVIVHRPLWWNAGTLSIPYETVFHRRMWQQSFVGSKLVIVSSPSCNGHTISSASALWALSLDTLTSVVQWILSVTTSFSSRSPCGSKPLSTSTEGYFQFLQETWAYRLSSSLMYAIPDLWVLNSFSNAFIELCFLEEVYVSAAVLPVSRDDSGSL